MRQIFKCIAATAIAACFASCEKSYEELDPQFPAISDGKSVAISSGETVTIDFTLNDVRGNDITVKIDDNAVEDYKVSYTLNSGNDDGTISIAAPAMILDGTPFNVNVTFSDEINNRTASKTVNVTPTVLEGYVKLSEAANSFIVAPGAYVQFPTFKGNSGLKSGAVSLALAWQDAVGLFAEVAQVNESDAIVHFASGKEGNAVINGLDASGNVVWSWLFWVTADAPKDVKVGDFTFQDRNIGALNLDEKSELSVGLVYQYGRKDPFPGIRFDELEARPVYDASGAEVEIKIVKNTEANNLETQSKTRQSSITTRTPVELNTATAGSPLTPRLSEPTTSRLFGRTEGKRALTTHALPVTKWPVPQPGPQSRRLPMSRSFGIQATRIPISSVPAKSTLPATGRKLSSEVVSMTV